MKRVGLKLVPSALAMLLCGIAGARAEERPPLSEISVLGRRTADARPVPGVDRIGSAEIGKLDPGTAAEMLRLAPAAHLQTNSRGETLVFLRGAGERQVAVFYDGALLNIPWDNRVDLSMIPAAAIGGLSVAKGPVGVEFGANASGGAINLTSRAPASIPERFGIFTRFGGDGLRDHRGDAAFRLGGLDLALGASRRTSDGLPLPGGADLPFNQIGGDVRTNTDSEFFNLFLRGETAFGEDGRLGFSVFHVEGEKGVAPEGNVAPEDGPRLWRLPQWDMTTAILSGEGRIGTATGWKGSLWVQAFAQTIDSFESLAFDRRDSRQEDDDLTFGARLVVDRDLGPLRLVYAFNGLVSEHDQKDTPFVDDVARPSEALDLTFRQWTLANGLGIETTLPGGVEANLGAGFDLMTAPATGDKPPIADFAVWTLDARLVRRFGDGWTARAAAGRKVRFPTMRELFGEALGRFLINPDLAPESTVLLEIGIAREGARGRFGIVPFATFTDDTIDQRVVEIDGRALRQRVNLRGSRALGIEIEGEVDLGHGFALAGHLTLLDTDRLPDFPGDFTRLSEKPEIIGRAALDYAHEAGFSAMAEVVHTGRAFSLTDDDIFTPLEVSTVLNLRIARTLAGIVPGLGAGEIFFRVDNATDSLVEPQAGLPGAGRRISGGISARF